MNQARRRQQLLSFCFCFVFSIEQSLAANLTLFTDSLVNAPVEVLPDALTEPIAIGVVNDATPDLPEDFLTGWQVSLAIIPEVGATGSVTFASPQGPLATEPTGYLLEGINLGITVINSGDELVAFDFNFPASGGVEVPTDPGSLLFLIELLTSNDAQGSFGIYAIPGSGNTEWTDAAPVIQQSRTFENVPVGQGPVLIGLVRVVPEPSSLAFGVIAVGAISLTGRRGSFICEPAPPDIPIIC